MVQIVCQKQLANEIIQFVNCLKASLTAFCQTHRGIEGSKEASLPQLVVITAVIIELSERHLLDYVSTQILTKF